MEQPRSIVALFHKFRLVLNFDQRCSRHVRTFCSEKRGYRVSSATPTATRDNTGFVLGVFSSPLQFFSTERIPNSIRCYVICSGVHLGQQFIFREYLRKSCRKITRRKSPYLRTFSSKKTTLFLALRNEHYLQGILKIFLCSNAAIFKEAISHR